MKSKNLLLIALMLLNVLIMPEAFAQKKSNKKTKKATEINWYTFEDAVKRNNKKPKKIFIDVYTDWCGWCKKMDASTFKDPAVVAYINKYYYPVKLNAEQQEQIKFKGQDFVNPNPGKTKSTHQLAIALLKQELSYPSYVILDGDSEWLFKLRGYKTAEDLLPVLKYYGSNQYKVMSWNDFNQLKTL